MPKPVNPWRLTKHETIDSFKKWRHHLLYVLSLNSNYTHFLVPGITWLESSKENPNRGFTDDKYVNAKVGGTTAKQKVDQLESMLESIASYCPIILRNSIVGQSTSLESVWQIIRAHFGFHYDGCNLLDIGDIRFEPNENTEDLYKRLMKCVKQNLLVSDSGITHYGQIVNRNERLSPTLENIVVLMWLNLIHHDLPQLVKKRFKTALRTHTLASLKPSITQAMNMLLDEINFSRAAQNMLSAPSESRVCIPLRPAIKPKPSCTFCQQTDRPNLQRICRYLNEKRRRNAKLSLPLLCDEVRKTRKINNKQIKENGERVSAEMNSKVANRQRYSESDVNSFEQGRTGLVSIKQSPFFHVYYRHHPLKVTIDSGAETNMIKERVAHEIGAKITRTSQLATQADGQSPLVIKGETRINLKRNRKCFFLEALVVENIDVDVLAGVPFMASNDISVRPAKHQIITGDGTVYEYGAVTLNVDRFTRKSSVTDVCNNPYEPSLKIEELSKRLELLKNN